MVGPLDLASHIVSTTHPPLIFSDAHVKPVNYKVLVILNTGCSSLCLPLSRLAIVCACVSFRLGSSCVQNLKDSSRSTLELSIDVTHTRHHSSRRDTWWGSWDIMSRDRRYVGSCGE